jgi:hypothetical protein
MSVAGGSIRKGVVIGCSVSVAAVAFLVWQAANVRTATGQWTFESLYMLALLFIGITQIVWVVPLSLVFLFAKRMQTLKGVLRVALFLLAMNVTFIIISRIGR